MGRKAKAFAMIANLCQLGGLPTCISDHLGRRARIVHLILTSVPSSSSNVNSLCLLGLRDHCPIPFPTFFLVLFRYSTLDAPFGADWNDFRDFLAYP